MTPALQGHLVHRRLAVWLFGCAAAVVLALAAAFVTPLALVALPLVVGAGFAFLRWPWLGVALLIASVPVQQVGAVAGGSITLTRLSLAVATIGLLLWWVFSGRTLQGSLLLVPFVALLGWMFVTAQVAASPGAAGAEIFRWFVALFAFWAALQVLVGTSERMLTVVIVTIALAGALEAGFGSIVGLLGLGPESFQIQDSVSRAYGTFGRPNTFAGYLEMAVFPVLWYGLYRAWHALQSHRAYVSARRYGFAASSVERRNLAFDITLAVLLLGSASMMLAGVLISFSRGAWLGVIAGVALSSIVALRRFWPVIIAATPLAAIALTVALVLFAPATLTERLTSISDEARPFDASTITINDDNFAVVERMAHWQAGWRMFADNPLTGVGAGNFNTRYDDYYVRVEFQHSQGHAHNFYVHMLAENGVIGLAIYLTLVLSFWFVALRVALSSPDRLAGALALGALGTMTAVLVHNVFENLHVLNLGVQLSVSWAMAIAAYHRWRIARGAVRHSSVEYSRR